MNNGNHLRFIFPIVLGKFPPLSQAKPTFHHYAFLRIQTAAHFPQVSLQGVSPHLLFLFSKLSPRDFPGGPVVKTLPSNAGGTGSTPGRGAKIPHALRQKTKT